MTKLTKKIAHIVSGDLISKGFAFLLTIYLARVLGTEGYGMVTIALAFLGYGVFFGDFGLFTIGTREAAKTSDNREFQSFEILVARMSLATLVFFVAWFIFPAFISDHQQLILTRRYLITMLIHAYLVEWYFNGIQRYDVVAISRSIQMGVYAIGAFIFIKNPSDILQLPIFYVIGYFISAVILLSIAFKANAFSISKSGVDTYKRLMKSSSSIGSGFLFSHVIQLLPPITIGIFLTKTDAGLYGAAYRLILIGMLIDRLFVQLLIPNLAKHWTENKAQTIINLEHTSRIMLTIGSIISLFIAVGAVDISSFLFGDEFLNSAPIITALCLYLFFTFQNSMFSHGLVAIGKDVEFFKAASNGGIIAIILIVTTSLYFNSAMVGLAVAISELTIAILCFYKFRKSLAFSYIVPFIATLLISLLIFFGSTFVELSPIIKAILASSMLGIFLLVFKIMRIADLQWLKSILLR